VGISCCLIPKTAEEGIFIDMLCKHLDIVNLNESIIDEVIRIRKEFRIKLPDAIILATAIVSGCTLVTHNTSDFDTFSSIIQLVDPLDKNFQNR
jgi:predicted nucleic acid-binding protein